MGVHPCTAHTFATHPGGPTALLAALRSLATTGASAGTVTAFGEIGLDYDRLFLCDKGTQLQFFEAQLELAAELDLPLFLHSRAAHEDFSALLRRFLDRLPRRGCVHSFTGTVDEMRQLVEMGFDIGVNGCSLKTEENLAVVREIPLERLQLETDGPWVSTLSILSLGCSLLCSSEQFTKSTNGITDLPQCEMRPSHASAKFLDGAPEVPRAVKKEKWTADLMVKGRNEPCTIGRVAQVVANVKGISVEELCRV